MRMTKAQQRREKRIRFLVNGYPDGETVARRTAVWERWRRMQGRKRQRIAKVVAMHPIEAQNKARLALLDTLEPVCQEVDAIDIALQHYHQVLAECGYGIALVEDAASL